MPVCYRIRQFVRTVRQPQAPPDLGRLAGLLSAEQRALFSSLAVVDQYHCLAVAQALAAQGHEQPDLLRAALVHDIGKARAHISTWERVAHVLLMRCAPTLAGRLGSARAGEGGHGLYVLAHHAALGGDLAAQAGLAPAVVALVRGDGDPQLQAALRDADDTQ